MKYRVGKKQNRAILNDKGVEVAICHKGQEGLAEKICELLNNNENNKHKDNPLLRDTTIYIDKC